jgi:lipid-A-disaccharide synthase
MKPATFMVIAGEASGDMLAAQLVRALRQEMAATPSLFTNDYQPLYTSFDPRFFGAGGPEMAKAGVELAVDLTTHATTGFWEVISKIFTFWRIFRHLYKLALDREPDAIICVDFGGFNLRFARAIRRFVRHRADWFHDWKPRLIQYISPQVWASREGRAYRIARDYDLLISTFAFEAKWYAKRVPNLHVEFVGHPILDRHQYIGAGETNTNPSTHSPTVLLLPGSRTNELKRHIPVLVGALALIRASIPNLQAVMVLPDDATLRQAKAYTLPSHLEVRSGGLPDALSNADVALASTGTVTLECAYFGVPTVAFYKTSWPTYQVARRVATVNYVAMPNLLANEEVFPEFLQDAATPENVSAAALDLLRNQNRRAEVNAKLSKVVALLGEPGASHRAARAILKLLRPYGQAPVAEVTR